VREHGMVGENRQSMVRPVQFRIVHQHYSGALVHVFCLSPLCCAIHQALNGTKHDSRPQGNTSNLAKIHALT
jgi:hypothetical protein